MKLLPSREVKNEKQSSALAESIRISEVRSELSREERELNEYKVFVFEEREKIKTDFDGKLMQWNDELTGIENQVKNLRAERAELLRPLDDFPDKIKENLASTDELIVYLTKRKQQVNKEKKEAEENNNEALKKLDELLERENHLDSRELDIADRNEKLKDAVNEEAEEGEDGDGTETQDQPNEEDLDEAALFEKFKAFVKGEKVASSAPIKKVPEKELEDPKGSLKEGVIVAELRGELKDLNVLAAKLLYQNKTLIENSLTESQKAKVIVAFDKVKTVDEAKLIFETLTAKNKTTKTTKRKPLGESFGLISLNKKTITESAQPSGTEYSEEQKLMMKRAGIKF